MLTPRELDGMKDNYRKAICEGRPLEAVRLKKIIDMNEGRYVSKPYPRMYKFRGRN